MRPLRTLLNVAVYGALLFGPAGTLRWWRAWVLLALVFVGMSVTRRWAFGDDDGLLAERRKAPFQAGQPRADKLLSIAFLIVSPAYVAFISLDAFHLHLLQRPTAFVAAAGLVCFVAGAYVIALAFRENAFAAAIVRHQYERLQFVVDTGVYRRVRHPLYSGVVLILVGIALWLESYAAAIASVVPIALLGLRISVEEAFLSRELDGYAGYLQRVRYRLVPGLW